MQKYNGHTEPLFKTLQLLKVNDILKVQQFNFILVLYIINCPSILIVSILVEITIFIIILQDYLIISTL